MALILVGVTLVGVLANKALYLVGLQLMEARYPLAVLASYLAFFGAVRLWIAYVHAAAPPPLQEPALAASLAGGAALALTSPRASPRRASGSRFEPGDVPGDVEDVVDASDGAIEGAGAVGEAAGSADEGLVLVLFAAVLLGVIFAGGWLVWQAPVILSEAAFSAVLAGALRRAAKGEDGPHWAWAVFKKSVVPFVVVALVAAGAAYGVRVVCPQARTLKGALHCDKDTAAALAQ